MGAGIRMVPAQIRADLVRAIGTNGRVDAAGEQCYTRTSIPRSIQRMAAALAEHIQVALRADTAGDESGLQYLSPPAAFKLAQSALVGEFKVREFAREMRLALNVAGRGMSALDELREAWRLVKSALLAVSMPLYGMSHCDEGVMQVDARINATAASLRLERGDMRTWLCRVLDAWGLRVRKFRQVDGEWPVFAECTRPSAANSFRCMRLRQRCGSKRTVWAATGGRRGSASSRTGRAWGRKARAAPDQQKACGKRTMGRGVNQELISQGRAGAAMTSTV